MAIIEVPDISIVKTVNGSKQLLSLRDQKIKKDGALHSFGVGSGVKCNGDLYVLESGEGDYMVKFTSTAQTLSFGLWGIESLVDWGDGVSESFSYGGSHTYTDGKSSHEIKIYRKDTDLKILFLGAMEITSLDVSKCIGLQQLRVEENMSLTELDVSKNIELLTLWINDTQIGYLDLNNSNIREIYCYNTPLVTDRDSLVYLANKLPSIPPGTVVTVYGTLKIENQTSAAWIQDICTAKNWTIQ